MAVQMMVSVTGERSGSTLPQRDSWQDHDAIKYDGPIPKGEFE